MDTNARNMENICCGLIEAASQKLQDMNNCSYMRSSNCRSNIHVYTMSFKTFAIS